MQHERQSVVRKLLWTLGVPDGEEGIERGGLLQMTLSHINGVPFMPLKFGNTPLGVRVWQWEELTEL